MTAMPPLMAIQGPRGKPVELTQRLVAARTTASSFDSRALGLSSQTLEQAEGFEGRRRANGYMLHALDYSDASI